MNCKLPSFYFVLFRGRYINLLLGQKTPEENGRRQPKIHPAQTWTFPNMKAKAAVSILK
jgi:hypothetical protein